MRGKGSLAVLALGTTTALTATALLWWRARHGRKRKLPRRGTMPSLGDDTEEPLGRFSLPLSIALRTLRSSDFSHSFLTLLEQLTEVGSIDEGFFHSRLQRCGARSNTHLVVAEDEQTGRVLASGTVVTELKLIHQCGLVGHIEDVVVDACVRRKGLGRRVVRTLLDLAREAGAYKCILDCMEHNVPFYESCGFKRKEVMMINYLDDAVKGQGPRSTALERALQPQETTQGLVVRPVRASDYSGTLLSLLSQLTVVGHVSQAHFDARVAVLGETQHLLVIEDTQNGQQGQQARVVAAGTLLVERKFIHSGGLAAHIEDVVVDSTVRGKGLGKLIITKLVELAKAAGCYKVVLDCSEANVGFYKKCGFEQKEVQMACYF